jgi:hypothetical protein
MPRLNDREFPSLPSKGGDISGSRLVINGVSGDERAFATIDDLPEELLLEILHYLPGIDLENSQLASLVSLSSTNKRFHRLVAKDLYRTYNSHFCEPYLFLRTVITNADLASHVEYADLTYGTWAHRQLKRYTASAQDKKIIKEGLKALGMANWKTWATDCNTNLVEVDTLHTAILMHIPNIYSLNITDGQIADSHGTKSPKWMDLFRRADHGTSVGRMHRFENLRTIRIEVDELTLTKLAPVFRTPSLRKLHLKGLLEYHAGGHHSEQILQHIIPPRYNNLEEIRLEDSAVQIDALGVLIASARSLKTFRYEMALGMVPAVMDADIEGKITFDTALSCQKTSLESVSFLVDLNMAPYYPRTLNLHEGLQDFTTLKHLRCALSCIADRRSSHEAIPFDKLPRSLTTLHLIVDEVARGALVELEQNAYQLIENLRLLQEFRITSEPDFRGLYDWTRLVAAFSQIEISLVVEDEEDKGDGWSESWGLEVANIHVPASDVESESSGEVSLYSNE